MVCQTSCLCQMGMILSGKTYNDSDRTGTQTDNLTCRNSTNSDSRSIALTSSS